MTVKKVLSDELKALSQEEVEDCIVHSMRLLEDLIDSTVLPESNVSLRNHLESLRIALYIIQTMNLDRLLLSCEAQETFNKDQHEHPEDIKC